MGEDVWKGAGIITLDTAGLLILQLRCHKPGRRIKRIKMNPAPPRPPNPAFPVTARASTAACGVHYHTGARRI